MVEAMHVQAQLGSGTSFTVTSGSGHQLTLDTVENNGGDTLGPCPMEVVLAALAGCAGIGIIGIVRKMKQEVSDYAIRVQGERTSVYPQTFTHITIEHIFTGRKLQASILQRAVDLDTARYCAVQVLFSSSVQITHSVSVHEEV